TSRIPHPHRLHGFFRRTVLYSPATEANMKSTSSLGVALLLGLSLACRVGTDNARKSNAAEPPTSDKQAADGKVADVAQPLLGSWKNDEDNESVIRFEATKCTFARLGKSGCQIFRATYEPGKIVLHIGGFKGYSEFQVKNQVLSTTLNALDGKIKTYRKLDKI